MNNKIFIIECKKQKIEKSYQLSKYFIKTINYNLFLPSNITRLVDNNWVKFLKKEKNAKNNITYFFKSFNSNKNIDYVHPAEFKYIQSFGRTKSFNKYSCLGASKHLIALSSFCLIKTSDNFFVFGIKKNMDDKISGFSGYIQKKYFINNHLNIYKYLEDNLKSELNISSKDISKIIKIGQTFSPNITDDKDNLNNKVFNNDFLVYLNINSKNLQKKFKESFQFHRYLIFLKQSQLIEYIKENYPNISIHCVGAIMCYFKIFKKELVLKLYNVLPKKYVIFKQKIKHENKNIINVIKQLKIYKWGLIGNSKIIKYSVAPDMWKYLFKKINMPLNYLVINSDDQINIVKKINLLLKDDSFCGANIALPWKELLYKFCNKKKIYENINSINTIVKKKKIIGYNTDGIGLINSMKKFVSLKNKNILIIGAGGGAQTIPYYLFKEKINKLYVYDKNHAKAKNLIIKYSSLYRKNFIFINKNKINSIFKNIDIIINATPCGMVNFPDKYPIYKQDIKKIKKSCLIAEMVYNPKETPLIKEAKKYGILTCPGYHMLIEQAAKSFEYGFNFKLTKKQKKYMENIIINKL